MTLAFSFLIRPYRMSETQIIRKYYKGKKIKTPPERSTPQLASRHRVLWERLRYRWWRRWRRHSGKFNSVVCALSVWILRDPIFLFFHLFSFKFHIISRLGSNVHWSGIRFSLLNHLHENGSARFVSVFIISAWQLTRAFGPIVRIAPRRSHRIDAGYCKLWMSYRAIKWHSLFVERTLKNIKSWCLTLLKVAGLHSFSSRVTGVHAPARSIDGVLIARAETAL